MATIINIANDFSDTPGGRYRSDGPFSGEEFREKFLEPLFKDSSNAEEIRIVFDGALGYAISFLEEAFGGIARKYGKNTTLKRLVFVSNEDPLLCDEILELIKDVKK